MGALLIGVIKLRRCDNVAKNINPNSLANLKVSSPTEARKNGSKGGKARAEKAKKMREAKEYAKAFSGLPPDMRTLRKMLQRGIEEGDANIVSATVWKIAEMGYHGNLNCAKYFLMLLGQDPESEMKKQSVSKEKTDTDITINFHPASERPEDESMDE